MSKHRDMRRTDWQRVTKRRYVCREVPDIFGAAGRIALIAIDAVTAPLTVHYQSRDVLIADRGFSWFQAAVPDAHWWLTAMYGADDRLIQIYFDITAGNRFEEPENLTFEDRYLDIVLSADGFLEIVDRDELDDALQNGILTAAQHEEAVREGDKLYHFLKENTESVFAWCAEQQKLLKAEI